MRPSSGKACSRTSGGVPAPSLVAGGTAAAVMAPPCLASPVPPDKQPDDCRASAAIWPHEGASVSYRPCPGSAPGSEVGAAAQPLPGAAERRPPGAAVEPLVVDGEVAADDEHVEAARFPRDGLGLAQNGAAQPLPAAQGRCPGALERLVVQGTVGADGEYVEAALSPGDRLGRAEQDAALPLPGATERRPPASAVEPLVVAGPVGAADEQVDPPGSPGGRRHRRDRRQEGGEHLADAALAHGAVRETERPHPAVELGPVGAAVVVVRPFVEPDGPGRLRAGLGV